MSPVVAASVIEVLELVAGGRAARKLGNGTVGLRRAEATDTSD
ncbi:hypothetical protein [Nocardia pseudovaccinii]|nr:hypothetical protein [Nocardia pseudovaccinii]